MKIRRVCDSDNIRVVSEGGRWYVEVEKWNSVGLKREGESMIIVGE
jgi:hypothetical protein